MRIIANFHKGEALRFISHLDVQRLVQRAMRRARLPLRYSQGFNPHPLLAFASALSVGHTSDAEWMDVRLEKETSPQVFLERMNAALPAGMRVLRVMEIEETLPALTALIRSTNYEVLLKLDAPPDEKKLKETAAAFMRASILVDKKTKSGVKQVDLQPFVLQLDIIEAAEDVCRLFIKGVLNAAGGLPVDLFIRSLMQYCALGGSYRVHRSAVAFDKIEV
ncbi:MAG: TIGR03936 family radical SAM-associated protein [Clostridiales bacterium]|nr:TIGR03936 family radical SAM-associated protein [Clostridiales bacterium]